MARNHCNDTPITSNNEKFEDWINGLSDVHACLHLVLKLQVQHKPKTDIEPTFATLIELLMGVMQERLDVGSNIFL